MLALMLTCRSDVTVRLRVSSFKDKMASSLPLTIISFLYRNMFKHSPPSSGSCLTHRRIKIKIIQQIPFQFKTRDQSHKTNKRLNRVKRCLHVHPHIVSHWSSLKCWQRFDSQMKTTWFQFEEFAPIKCPVPFLL